MTVAISHLRKVLGPEYIETIPRVGYRFMGEVREICEERPSLIIEKRTISRTVIEEEIAPDVGSGSTASGRPLLRAPMSRISRRLLAAAVVLGLMFGSVAIMVHLAISSCEGVRLPSS